MGSQDDRSDAGSCPEDIQDAACVDTEPVHADEEDPECAGTEHSHVEPGVSEDNDDLYVQDIPNSPAIQVILGLRRVVEEMNASKDDSDHSGSLSSSLGSSVLSRLTELLQGFEDKGPGKLAREAVPGRFDVTIMMANPDPTADSRDQDEGSPPPTVNGNGTTNSNEPVNGSSMSSPEPSSPERPRPTIAEGSRAPHSSPALSNDPRDGETMGHSLSSLSTRLGAQLALTNGTGEVPQSRFNSPALPPNTTYTDSPILPQGRTPARFLIGPSSSGSVTPITSPAPPPLPSTPDRRERFLSALPTVPSSRAQTPAGPSSRAQNPASPSSPAQTLAIFEPRPPQTRTVSLSPAQTSTGPSSSAQTPAVFEPRSPPNIASPTTFLRHPLLAIAEGVRQEQQAARERNPIFAQSSSEFPNTNTTPSSSEVPTIVASATTTLAHPRPQRPGRASDVLQTGSDEVSPTATPAEHQDAPVTPSSGLTAQLARWRFAEPGPSRTASAQNTGSAGQRQDLAAIMTAQPPRVFGRRRSQSVTEVDLTAAKAAGEARARFDSVWARRPSF